MSSALRLHAGIFEQEPLSVRIVSPMVVKAGREEPTPQELYPTLNIEGIVEAQPEWQVVKAGVLRKMGEGFYAKAHKFYHSELTQKGALPSTGTGVPGSATRPTLLCESVSGYVIFYILDHTRDNAQKRDATGDARHREHS